MTTNKLFFLAALIPLLVLPIYDIHAIATVYNPTCTVQNNSTCSYNDIKHAIANASAAYKQTCTVKMNGTCDFGFRCTDQLSKTYGSWSYNPTCQGQIDEGTLLCMKCDYLHPKPYLNATTIPFNGTYYVKSEVTNASYFANIK